MSLPILKWITDFIKLYRFYKVYVNVCENDTTKQGKIQNLISNWKLSLKLLFKHLCVFFNLKRFYKHDLDFKPYFLIRLECLVTRKNNYMCYKSTT